MPASGDESPFAVAESFLNLGVVRAVKKVQVLLKAHAGGINGFLEAGPWGTFLFSRSMKADIGGG